MKLDGLDSNRECEFSTGFLFTKREKKCEFSLQYYSTSATNWDGL